MSNTFHFAVPAGSLEVAKTFYCDLLGCETGNSEEGRWVDIDFWGNELTLHESEEQLPKVRHDVDMGAVAVPHFGVHLTEEDFQALKGRIEASDKFDYLDKPYRRFIGTEFEQETFFIEDTNGNVLEIKTMMHPEVLFKKA
ncbi:glyoxalase [Alteromonadaceae bacterium M269]|nr:glyoxalase [Alteromonadaceae bacterium M269]